MKKNKLNKYKILFLVSLLCCMIAILDSQRNRNLYINTSISLSNAKGEIELLKSKVESQKADIEDLQKTKSQWISLGVFKITYYCDCRECQGEYVGTTAIGTKPKVNRTIAVDPSIIEIGSQIMIDNKIYVAEDTGGAIRNKKIDVFVHTHQEAKENGVKYKEVKIWKKR